MLLLADLFVHKVLPLKYAGTTTHYTLDRYIQDVNNTCSFPNMTTENVIYTAHTISANQCKAYYGL